MEKESCSRNFAQSETSLLLYIIKWASRQGIDCKNWTKTPLNPREEPLHPTSRAVPISTGFASASAQHTHTRVTKWMFYCVVVMTGCCIQDALIEEEMSKAGCLCRSLDISFNAAVCIYAWLHRWDGYWWVVCVINVDFLYKPSCSQSVYLLSEIPPPYPPPYPCPLSLFFPHTNGSTIFAHQIKLQAASPGMFGGPGNAVWPLSVNSHLSSRTCGVVTSCKRDRGGRHSGVTL